MLDLSSWTWSLSMCGSLIFVVRHQSLKSVVDIVLLLLQDAQVLIDGLMDIVEVGRSQLTVSPSDKQLVLFMLQLS